MSLIPQEILDEISSRLDLVSLIGDYVPLKKSGRDYKGLCPFHQEKSPSFMVSPEKGIYHCFGCAQGGNAFGFVMKIENLTFPETVRKLAGKAGVDLTPYENARDVPQGRDEIFYRINKYAAWFFAEQLKSPKGNDVRGYLQKRGISAETQETFVLGLAPPSWEELARFLQSKKVPMEEAEKLGLVRRRKDGSPYDFFRNRLMFPIMDHEGRVIAFGGRRLDDNNKEEAKYINSPESPVYIKGRSIYGLYQAKQSLRQTGEALLVEGYMDLIRIYQEGIKNVAAPLGTALTPQQVNTLSRFAQKYVLIFDGDVAGQQASLRALNLFLEGGLHPRVFPLPVGDDPDTYIARLGGEAFAKELTRAPHALEWMLGEVLTRAGKGPAEKLEAVKRMLALVQKLPTALEQKTYTVRLAQFLGIPENTLDAQLTGRTGSIPNSNVRSKNANSSKFSLERILIQLYLKYPNVVGHLITDEIVGEFEDDRLKNLGQMMLSEYRSNPSLSPGQWLKPGTRLDENFVSELMLELDSPESEADVEKMANDCLQRWRERKTKQELKQLTNEIQLAEMKNDRGAMERLIARKLQILAEHKK